MHEKIQNTQMIQYSDDFYMYSSNSKLNERTTKRDNIE